VRQQHGQLTGGASHEAPLDACLLEHPSLAGSVETVAVSVQRGGGGCCERAMRWRRPRQADVVVQASGALERGVEKTDRMVEVERSRENFFFLLTGRGWN
jgi:hypothetical protein